MLEIKIIECGLEIITLRSFTEMIIGVSQVNTQWVAYLQLSKQSNLNVNSYFLFHFLTVILTVMQVILKCMINLINYVIKVSEIFKK